VVFLSEDKLEEKIRILDIKIDKLKAKKKRSEDLKTYEAVVDKFTLMTLYDLANKGFIRELYGVLSTGKEANVYLGKNKSGEEYAVKIYRTSTAEFKKMSVYITGDPRFKNMRKGTRRLIYMWAEKEFKNLKRAYRVQVRVPEPIIVKNNVLIMEFIGKKGKSAPQLKQVVLDNPQEVYEKIITYVKRLYHKARLVHSDLSEFNILYFNKEPVIIDISQAVLTSHPLANEFLARDLKNVLRYFKGIGLNVPSLEEVFREVVEG